MGAERIIDVRREASSRWWIFLITGVAWIWLSVVVLQFDLRSVSAIGVLAGDFVARTMDTRMLTRVAGAAFIAIGLWTFATA